MTYLSNYYNSLKTMARTILKAPISAGGYAISGPTGPARALALLQDENYLYAGGVRSPLL